MSDIKHVFEHLGKPPYRFAGYEQKTYQACPGAPIQVGGCCDHCSTGIIDTYYFVSADGKRFKVGSSCVEKSGDKGLYSQIQKQVNKIKTERRHAKEAAVIATTRAQLTDNNVRLALSAKPHPTKWAADQGKTLLDWAEWMMANSGNTGRMKVAKLLETLGA